MDELKDKIRSVILDVYDYSCEDWELDEAVARMVKLITNN
jgi:hypothetical protein